jgi:formylglycine-generating enzyme required for sulfatase activity
MIEEINRDDFEFDTITVNESGREIRRERGRAEFFVEYLDNNTLLEMVAIPAGNFLMGVHPEEIRKWKRISRSKSERNFLGRIYYDLNLDELDNLFANNNDASMLGIGSSHRVTLPSFFISKFAVTQAQWLAVTLLPRVNLVLNPQPSHFKGANRPVECVSLYEAMEFCDRLSQKTGKTYRLPSESEWEYACRAGTTTSFHFGETITTDLANYNGSYYIYNYEPTGQYLRATTPVGSYQIANAFGLYDMHGNVSEWCQDNLNSTPYKGAPTDGTAWIYEADATPSYFLANILEPLMQNLFENPKYRVYRGGSWKDDVFGVTSWSRWGLNSENKENFIGFRVVQVHP